MGAGVRARVLFCVAATLSVLAADGFRGEEAAVYPDHLSLTAVQRQHCPPGGFAAQRPGGFAVAKGVLIVSGGAAPLWTVRSSVGWASVALRGRNSSSRLEEGGAFLEVTVDLSEGPASELGLGSHFGNITIASESRTRPATVPLSLLVQTACRQCPPHSATPVARGGAGGGAWGPSDCACDDGFFNVGGGGPELQCRQCPGGQRYNAARNACEACPAGTFKDHAGQDTTCRACPLHTYNPGTGAANLHACLACPAHAETNATGAVALSECKCAEGFFALGRGGQLHGRAGAGMECVQCGRGEYRESERGECVPCPAGKYKPTKGQHNCTVCPEDTYQPETGASALPECLECETFRQRSTTNGTIGAAASSACICEVGSYLRSGVPDPETIFQIPGGSGRLTRAARGASTAAHRRLVNATRSQRDGNTTSSAEDTCQQCREEATECGDAGLQLGDVRTAPGYWREDTASERWYDCLEDRFPGACKGGLPPPPSAEDEEDEEDQGSGFGALTAKAGTLEKGVVSQAGTLADVAQGGTLDLLGSTVSSGTQCKEGSAGPLACEAINSPAP